jgi:hypothetical protein
MNVPKSANFRGMFPYRARPSTFWSIFGEAVKYFVFSHYLPIIFAKCSRCKLVQQLRFGGKNFDFELMMRTIIIYSVLH